MPIATRKNGRRPGSPERGNDFFQDQVAAGGHHHVIDENDPQRDDKTAGLAALFGGNAQRQAEEAQGQAGERQGEFFVKFKAQQHIARIFPQLAEQLGKHQLRAAPGLADGDQVGDLFGFLGKKSQGIFFRVLFFEGVDHAVEKDDVIVLLKLLVIEPASLGKDQRVFFGIFHANTGTHPAIRRRGPGRGNRGSEKGRSW